MLEYNYVKNYSNFSIDPNVFNEYFYNVKKKFSKMTAKISKSSEVNEFNSLKKNYHVKGMTKNYSLVLPIIDKSRNLKGNFSKSPSNNINIRKSQNFYL